MRPRPIPALLCALALLAGCAPAPTPMPTPTPTPSPTPPPPVQTPAPTPSPAPQPLQVPEGLEGYALAYAQLVVETEAEAPGRKYELVYLDEDGVPELVMGSPGYTVSVYQYDDGTLYPVMDRWPYGVNGNHGYEYIPKGNTVRNDSASLAGAIKYIEYSKLGSNHEMEPYYDEALSYWMFLDKNGNHKIDEDEPFSDRLYYYYGDRELKETEFESYLIPGNYQPLVGSQSAACLLAQLQAVAQKEEWGLEGQLPYYAYRDEEGDLQLELYFDPDAGTGQGFWYHESFTLDSVEDAVWEERSPDSVLSVYGDDGSNMVQDYREDWEYDVAGRPVSFRSTGVSELRPEPINLISVDFQYRYDGTLERKKYVHNSMLFSTTLSSAVVHYDLEERPTYIRGYITHGYLEFYPIYGEHDTPDYCLVLDFMDKPYPTMYRLT